MSKFSIKVELQGLKIEVEGTKEDAPRLAQKVGEQIGNLVKPAMLLEANRTQSAEPNEDAHDGSGSRKPRAKKAGGGSASRSSVEDITVTIDPATHGAPRQEWTTAQKALWFLHVIQGTNSGGFSAYAITKAFNKHFKSAGMLNAGNVGRDLEKERLKGTGSAVGADTNDGAARYFLTDTGNKMAMRLAKGEAASAASAG
jgi:hypothetical protein